MHEQAFIFCSNGSVIFLWLVLFRSIRKLGQAGADGTFSSLLHSLMSKPEVQKTEQPVLVGSSPNNKGDDGDASLVELLFQHMRLESSHETATCLVELNVTEVRAKKIQRLSNKRSPLPTT